jgi:small subunit ribosomal protein S20
VANIKSAKKRIRQNRKRMLRNRMRKNLVRAAIKRFEAALAAGNMTQAEEALRYAVGRLHRAAQKGAIHRNVAARKSSRLTRRFNEAVRSQAAS